MLRARSSAFPRTSRLGSNPSFPCSSTRTTRTKSLARGTTSRPARRDSRIDARHARAVVRFDHRFRRRSGDMLGFDAGCSVRFN